MTMTVSSNYEGRTVDLEAFQTVQYPASLTPLTMTLRRDGKSRKVTGIQKLAQRYLILFMTNLGDIKYAEEQGTEFLKTVINGGVQTRSDVVILFAFANSNVEVQLDADDSSDDPPDERFQSAKLLSYDLDFANSRLYMRVLLTSLSGEDYEFIIPT